ncbi:sensor histidine kinase [Nocardioides sp. zg-ZUI104]|uniref:sensor histidine kinase n=1 Tax=Nocardioides faecalis TaxID=2803858 RepID=UPI001BCF28A2|nr:sensor histidine kinase [Nocardioides faecalis]MBS4754691.1 sensor histidine kinase [Nocardioides faecalis]
MDEPGVLMSWWVGGADLQLNPAVRRTVRLIAEGVVEFVGFRVAVISLVDDEHLQVVAILGPEEAVRRLSGIRIPLAELYDELDAAESWGSLRFLPAGDDAASATRIGPQRLDLFVPVRVADAWQPADRLRGLLRDDRGRLRGVLSVDLPVDGLRPGAPQLQTLEAYVRLAERALVTELERGVIEIQVARDHVVAADRLELVSALARVLRGAGDAIGDSVDAVRALVPATDDSGAALDLLRRAVDRVRRVADSVTTLARLEEPQRARRLSRVDLATVVREAVTLLLPVAQHQQVWVHTRLRGPVWLLGDPEDLHQMVSNLVSNAIKYSDADGRVTVGLAVREGPDGTADGARTAVLTVEDEGIGIPEADLGRVFEELYRGTLPEVGARQGTGLGLAIARRVATEHGAQIRVDSEVGRGTTFVVELPLDRPDPAV